MDRQTFGPIRVVFAIKGTQQKLIPIKPSGRWHKLSVAIFFNVLLISFPPKKAV